MRRAVTIVIPVFNNAALTADCLNALRDQKLDASIVVVDDCSTDETELLLETYGDFITVVRNESNVGFAAAVNSGAATAPPDSDLVFLNNDTTPHEGWLDALLRFADSNPRAGVVGARLLFPDGRIQHAGVAINQDRAPYHIYMGLPADHPAVVRPRQFQAVTAACLFVRRETWDQLERFDESYANALEDIDLCLRARELGWEVHYCPSCVVTHHESATRDRSPGAIDLNMQTFLQRWGTKIAPDDLQILADDGMLRVRYNHGNRAEIEVNPLVGQAMAPDAGETESMVAEATRRWLEAVEAREALVRKDSGARRAHLRIHSSGRIDALNASQHWTDELDPLTTPGVRFMLNKVAPLRLRIEPSARRRINVLYEGYTTDIFYGGHSAMIQLAGRLAEKGHDVRIVAVDNPGVPSPDEWHRIVREIGLADLARVEYVDCSDRTQQIEVSSSDRFIATNWWTMHTAHEAANRLQSVPPLWLQQEWEEIFFPGGAFASMCRAAYALDHSSLVSSELLHDFFASRHCGPHAIPGRATMTYRNALTTPPGNISRAPGRSNPDNGLLLYLRSVNRNSSEIVVAGVNIALHRGWIPDNWRISGVGSIDGGRQRVLLARNKELTMYPRQSPMRYRALLQSHDVGVALQDSPHPGLVSLDMAAAGMLAITSTYGPSKDAAAMRAISSNITAIEPTPEKLAEAIRSAVIESADLRARDQGSKFDWPRTPFDAFNDEVMSFVERVLAL